MTDCSPVQGSLYSAAPCLGVKNIKECSFLLLSVDAYLESEPISNSFATPFHLIKRKKKKKERKEKDG